MNQKKNCLLSSEMSDLLKRIEALEKPLFFAVRVGEMILDDIGSF